MTIAVVPLVVTPNAGDIAMAVCLGIFFVATGLALWLFRPRRRR